VPVTIIDAALSPSFLRRSCERLKQLLPQAKTVTSRIQAITSAWTPGTSYWRYCGKRWLRPAKVGLESVEADPPHCDRWQRDQISDPARGA
jgi:hypothetical protein